ncbi:hypothetical protein [Xanthocytophaga flava]|uniref:hypothetical protein n=1 Tax=Xanthocytophaga flava TaxID=3048013 RepID=UPI0028D728C3|nr:hypothetical protein [Xanthocytophaga flavus]MDJ1473215.1 hypothetical protein [Xanthocytophaga flavus]
MPNITDTKNLPIYNCHAHIFTGKHVPPWLGKKIIPWPFPYLISLPLVLPLIKLLSHHRKYHIPRILDKIARDLPFAFNQLWLHHPVTYFIARMISTIITCIALLLLISYLNYKVTDIEWLTICINYPRQYIPFLLQILIVPFGLLVIPSGRKLLLLLLQFLRKIPGPATWELFQRYHTLGRFALHASQRGIFEKLISYYPEGTRFLILPMDMTYMAAGGVSKSYYSQLLELRILKRTHPKRDQLLPFVFADPRRLAEQPAYYDIIHGLFDNCGFTGIKIYPALGYYPFDKHLLKLFLWASQNSIPIVTHAIRGIIFYRGLKQQTWNYHPVFKDSQGQPLKLYSFQNVDFINNFTHPLNYICLFEEPYLRQVLTYYSLLQPLDAFTVELLSLFGYTNSQTPLKHDLSQLKMCFGHFGGENEWNRYLTNDKSYFDNLFASNSAQTYPFMPDYVSKNIQQLWQSTSWFSIIRNCIMKYDNVYADISFTLHELNIITLLKECLTIPKLQDRILFGTDFYVVSHKKADKEIWIDSKSDFTPMELDRLARLNPQTFLY